MAPATFSPDAHVPVAGHPGLAENSRLESAIGQSLYHPLAPHVGDPEVHALLKVQLKVELEERSGMYSLLAQDLPAASVFEVLSTVDGLRSQFAGELKPSEASGAAPPPTVEREPAPPAGFEAAMRGAE